MTIDDDISDYVQQQFEAFQLAEVDQGSELAASSRVAAKIEKHVQILLLNDSIKTIGFDQKQTLSNVDVATSLIPLLVRYTDAALCMDTDADNRHVVGRVFDLVSATACLLSPKKDDAIKAIIDRAKTFSGVVSEQLRSQACAMLGYLASHVVMMLGRHEKNQLTSRETDCLKESLSMIEKLLVPRLTDKSQAVRQKAITAAGKFVGTFKSSSEVKATNPTSESVSSSSLLEGLLWSLWHDPSVANRVEAIQAVPIDSAEILDHVIARIRDVKEKVRIAAIRALREKVDPRRREIMTEEHFRDVVRSGLTQRCENTNHATMALICTKWTKAAKFCPVQLTRFIDATVYEEECEKALQVVLKMISDTNNIKSNLILQELSDPEIRSLRSNIDQSMIRLTDSDVVFDEYQLFYTRVACSSITKRHDLTFAQKESIIAKIIPDIPSLCDLFQKHLGRLVESIQEEDEECVDQECFVCLQLIQLTKISGLQEEGSRRYFANFMINILANAETPDELIEECVQALRSAFENEFDFFDAISLILAKLTSESSSGDSNEDHGRVLFIFSVVLESAPSTLSTHDLFDMMTKIVLSAVANPNTAIREVGIGCFGKLGLFSNKSTILSEFKPILLKIAAEKGEAIQCRGQSLLALSDWALIFSDVLQPCRIDSYSGDSLNLVSILGELMSHTNTTLATIAAEVATKLLFSVPIFDTSILASLIVLFLDPNNCEEFDNTSHQNFDIKDVGSPLRLQQLLSLFFPAFCLKSDKCRLALVNSIEKSLTAAVDYKPKKKTNSRSKTFPLIRIVDYIYSVVLGVGVVDNSVEAGKNDMDDVSKKVDISLSASLQVANFLVEKQQKLTVTQLRSMCKFLGCQDIKLEDREMLRLGKLKDLIEELSFLEDSLSLKALQPLIEILSSVRGYEDNNNDDENEDKDESDLHSDYETISENSTKGYTSESLGETTIEDKVMIDNIARLSLENKENPPCIVKTKSKSRRSSTQSNISVLGSLSSPNSKLIPNH